MVDEEKTVVTVADEGAEQGAEGGAQQVEQQRTEAVVDPTEELKAQHESLKADAEREKERRIAAEQREAREREARAAAEREAQSARTEVTDSRLATVDGGIEAAQTESAAAKAAYAQAMAEGDFNKAAEAQEKLADARAKLIRLNEAKADLESAKIERRTETRREDSRPSETDAVEAFIGGQDAATQRWLRDHIDDAKALALNGFNPRRAAKINAAHNDAVAEGHQVSTAEYFDHVERFLGMKKDDTQPEQKPDTKANGGKVEVKAHQRKAPSAPVAPVTGGSAGNGGTEVWLTKGEVAAATDGTHVWNYDDPSPQKRFKKGDVIGVQEFARRKKAMTDQGRYDKSFTEN